MIKLTLAILLLLAVSKCGSSRLIGDETTTSDGIYNATAVRVGATTITCEPSYGFLPCATELPGLLFLVVVYQYLLSLGQKYVSDGSDLFIKNFGPGIFGASLFNFLGTIPQVILIVASRLAGGTENAEAQSAIGMSILAGGAVFNLTLTWGIAVALGSYDFSDKETTTTTTSDVKQSSLTGWGVTTDVDTSYTARIMMISVIPLVIVQLTNVVSSSSGAHLIVLISLIVTLTLFISYNLYQIFQPWIQNRRFEYLTQKFVKDKLERLLSSKGKPNTELIRQIFRGIDKNNDTSISPDELRILVLGIQLEDDGFIRADYAEKVMEVFDISGDTKIQEDEFVNGLSKWLVDAQQPVSHLVKKIKTNNDTEEGQSLLVQTTNLPSADVSWRSYLNSAYLIILGIAISALLAMPFIESVVAVATTTSLPSFLIPYVVVPFALTFRSIGLMISSARQKTPTSISLTLSQIYGSVFVGNMMGLTMFLIVVYIRNIPVDASAEFLVAIVICTVMGLFTSFRTRFPLWTSYLVILLYPISLLILYVLTAILGWS